MATESELAKRNIELSFEFSRFLLSNPGLDAKIPQDAVIVFEVADDPELTAYNHTLRARAMSSNQSVIVVRIKSLAPTRLVEPEVVSSPRR